MIDLHERGRALAEHVHEQVDVTRGLERIVKGRRRSRVIAAVAVAAVFVALVGVVLVVRSAEDPAGDVASSDLETSLPSTVYLALLDDFAADADTGECAGTGVHAPLRTGIDVALVGETGDTIATGSVTPGVVVDATRIRALGLPSADTACLIVLLTTRADLTGAQPAFPSLGLTSWPLPGVSGAGSAAAGQQLTFYSRGSES